MSLQHKRDMTLSVQKGYHPVGTKGPWLCWWKRSWPCQCKSTIYSVKAKEPWPCQWKRAMSLSKQNDTVYVSVKGQYKHVGHDWLVRSCSSQSKRVISLSRQMGHDFVNENSQCLWQANGVSSPIKQW